jgi:peroxiredoxin
MLHPAQKVPDLTLKTVAHGTYELSGSAGENGTLLFVYRGAHCPLCVRQLAEIEEKFDQISALGVDVVAISGDGLERGQKAAEGAKAAQLKIGYEFDLVAARDDWGLHISKARENTQEADFYAEPGIFYIAPDQTLYFAWVQSSPFARPRLDDVISGIQYRLDKNYPPRGGYDGKLPGEA